MSHRNAKATSVALSGSATKRYKNVVASAVDTTSFPARDKILGALRANDFKTMLEWSDIPSPQLYDSATSYFVDCQISALIRKYPFTPNQVPGLNPESVALQKFSSAEHKVKWQNRKRRAKLKRFDQYAQIREYMRLYIASVLGETPPMQEIYDSADFTSGASIGVNGNRTNVARKLYAESWSVTPSALYHAKRALWSNIHARDCILPGAIKCYDPLLFTELVNKRVCIVDHNKISFVPKTAKTHRSIAIEPLLNGFVQKGIDIVMRDRLKKRAGLDLSDQSKNQALAREGSLGGINPYVTIDLSSASDSIATEEVKDLLPPDWYELLDEVRSPSYMLPGSNSVRKYEKFCSMGNGFCFPLQTLLFSSVCHAASRFCGAKRNEFSVYGDDIIARQSEALLIVEVLREMGFRTNVDKTFITGPFRESCGADWFEGQDVRPVQFDEPLTDVRQLFALHNSTLRSQRTELFFESVRPVIRAMGGGEYLRPGREPGDTAFSVPLDVAMSSRNLKWSRACQSWSWAEILSRPVEDPGRLGEVEFANARLLAVLRGSDSRMPFTLRYTSKPKRVRVTRPFRDGHLDALRAIERTNFQFERWCLGKEVSSKAHDPGAKQNRA